MTRRPPAPTPRYGERSLADLLPSVLAALSGRDGRANPLHLAPVERACVLLVDGLGAQLLERYAELAPNLAALAAGPRPPEPLMAGFPSTTATSMGSFGTGLPPGAHGLLGYEVAVPGSDEVLNELAWNERIDPRAWQPRSTVFERAAAEGIAVARIGPSFFDGSGLTEAALRGGRFVAAETEGERMAAAAAALLEGRRSLVYVYYGDLDATGHRCGVDSEAWRLQLEIVDRMVAQLAARLPAGAALWVTADHGMVDVPLDARVDLAAEPELAAGVRLLTGEPRARYVHARAGAEADVLAAWRERLGDRMDIWSRNEAVAGGWFGRCVEEHLRARIGDVVAVAREPVAVVDSAREAPELLRLVGLHGSVTDSEMLVPLLELRG
ncbi:MAG: alkaline phosphatase family protein [Actinomycetota bacterium]|nr:alkaline phosphatase family protein [Actinomycetota bacterium]